MSIGKGIVSVDDQLAFGKLVDDLSKYCYVVMYLPKSDMVLITYNTSNSDEVIKILEGKSIVSHKTRGSLAFTKFRWR